MRRPAPARLPSAIEVSVDLPMPGEPPSSTSEPGTRPPPSTRSSSPIPVFSRGIRGASTSASVTGLTARPVEGTGAPRSRPAAARRRGRRPSPRRPRRARREVGARLVDPHAARDVDEDVRTADPDAAVAAEDREHQREAVAIDPVGDPARRHQLARRDERLHLHQQRPRALHRGEHDAAGRAGGLAHERPRRPRPRPGRRRRISKTPTSFVEPKRFLSARSVRWVRSRSPSNCSTQSTRCSSTRGPASAPSFVTWPTSSDGDAALLGPPRDAVGDLAHLADRPGRAGQLAGVSVCTESTTQTSGRSASSVASRRRGPSPPARARPARLPAAARREA